MVNTASQCGFTPQYEGLQALHEAYRDQGLVVIGFPCDQFAHQEPGDDAEIEEFCRVNYGVDFPLSTKVDVNGAATDPVFAFLKEHASGRLGSAIKWNFTKFLVAPDGTTVKRYSPKHDAGSHPRRHRGAARLTPSRGRPRPGQGPKCACNVRNRARDRFAAAGRGIIRSALEGRFRTPSGRGAPPEADVAGRHHPLAHTGGLEMGHRPVADILDDWRTLDRALADATPGTDRIDLERAVADLADEHRAAVADQEDDATALGQLPALDGASATS